ncbi:MAG: class I SAM-dependent methyltransferase [Desulfovibrio sp.]|nr:class I SAM-dependent methyltransferase [Desulfovibrio sp.]MBI4959660.1 class I SAM-dependent methyltransferase [Desulfovibrio sp.]
MKQENKRHESCIWSQTEDAMLIPHAQDKYHYLINFCHWRKVHHIPGDFVEIGALFGEGTQLLSHYLSKECRNKLLHVIDVFDLDFDQTATDQGFVMKELYKEWLAERGAPSQWLLYLHNTRGLLNVRTLRGDSKAVILPASKIAFAFIDGNHQADYVQSDFNMIWNRLSPGGVVAFHDYKGDLPDVTRTIDELAERHATDLEYSKAVPRQFLYFMVKRRQQGQSSIVA